LKQILQQNKYKKDVEQDKKQLRHTRNRKKFFYFPICKKNNRSNWHFEQTISELFSNLQGRLSKSWEILKIKDLYSVSGEYTKYLAGNYTSVKSEEWSTCVWRNINGLHVKQGNMSFNQHWQNTALRQDIKYYSIKWLL